MQFPESWLRALVNPAIDTEALGHRLTMAGLEVEETAPAAPPFEGVVVAHILAVEPHPQADRLRDLMDFFNLGNQSGKRSRTGPARAVRSGGSSVIADDNDLARF